MGQIKLTLTKTDSPSFLQQFLRQGWNLMRVSVIHAGTLAGFTLCGSCTGHHSCCEIMRDMPCHVQKTLLCSSPLWPHPPLTTGSYNLSSPSSRMFPGAFRVDGGAGVILLFHLGPKDSEVTMCLCFGQLEVSELTIFNYKKRLLWRGMRTTLSVGTRVNTWKAIWCYVHLAKW